MGVFPDELPRRALSEDADHIAGWFENSECGFLQANHRVMQLAKVVRSQCGRIAQPSDANWAQLIQAHKDLQEWAFIIDVFGSKLLDVPFIDVLRRSVDDHALPQDSGADTPGRNAQFELLVSAIAYRAGLAPEHRGPGTSDWVVKLPNVSYAIETKRLKTLDSLERHFKKACTQIARTGVRGIVIVDLSRATNPAFKPFDYHVSEGVLREAQSKRCNAFRENYFERMLAWRGDRSVDGFVFHDHMINRPAEEGSGWILQGFWEWTALCEDALDAGSVPQQFQVLFASALPNW